MVKRQNINFHPFDWFYKYIFELLQTNTNKQKNKDYCEAQVNATEAFTLKGWVEVWRKTGIQDSGLGLESLLQRH